MVAALRYLANALIILASPSAVNSKMYGPRLKDTIPILNRKPARHIVDKENTDA
jgi:hypothetical protein